METEGWTYIYLPWDTLPTTDRDTDRQRYIHGYRKSDTETKGLTHIYFLGTHYKPETEILTDRQKT